MESQAKPLLTKRQKEVILMVGEGKTNEEIAANLSVSMQNIKLILNNLYKRLSCKNRAHLVQYSLNNNLLTETAR